MKWTFQSEKGLIVCIDTLESSVMFYFNNSDQLFRRSIQCGFTNDCS